MTVPKKKNQMYSAQPLYDVEKCAVCLGDICTETRRGIHVYGDTVAVTDFRVLDLSQVNFNFVLPCIVV